MTKNTKPANFHQRWTEADDQLLTELVQKGKNGTQISKLMGRTRTSIYGRKFTLGIGGIITKTPKGQSNDLTWGTRTKGSTETVAPEVKEVAKEVKPEKAPKAEKKAKEVKEKKTRAPKETHPYTYKLAQYCMRRRRGDFSKVAQITGFSRPFVDSVLNGKCMNERILNVAYNMAKTRKPFII
jgi:hypothetical protein